VFSILLSGKGLNYYGERIWHILAGTDWGLIFTAPLALVGLFGFRTLKGKKYFFLPLAATLTNFYMCIRWGTQGSWYGYRYFIFVVLPFAIMGFRELWERWFAQRKTWALVPLSLLSIPPILSMLAFEGNSTTLTLMAGRTKWDQGYVNNTYQRE